MRELFFCGFFVASEQPAWQQQLLTACPLHDVIIGHDVSSLVPYEARATALRNGLCCVAGETCNKQRVAKPVHSAADECGVVSGRLFFAHRSASIADSSRSPQPPSS
eukprot:SAG11_NODE_2191_length_3706_cov_2.096756_1_plen_106_part_10